MKNIQDIKFHTGSKEELLPDFTSEFPYIASKVERDRYVEYFAPWHWHKSVELFYIKSGTLEYYTPGGKITFPAGSGGMVNSNVLHMTKTVSIAEQNVQLLHIFDVSLLAGEQGSRIEKKYITPIVSAPQVEIIPLFPENAGHEKILECIVEAFQISNNEFGYEIKLREALSKIWILLFEEIQSVLRKDIKQNKSNEKIKMLMVYIHEHYSEKISISELAAAAYLSERECFRVFHDCLHMTPVEYIKSYRLQIACQMLARGDKSITFISHASGLGSSSYFGKVFREYAGYTPLEYRRKWQDNDII